ncbi:RDD family protein [Runella sp.]|uniref:RDD family protein n=1 Tax=Runella sp. TaxID=1960881 RepID=UPI002632F224|nr:RDD family protein [Runella sp.]
MDKSQLAGFGNRLVAQIIDGIILSIAISVVLVPFIAALLGTSNWNGSPEDVVAWGIVGMIIGIALLSLFVPFIYEAIMISSARQATFGKILMKIKVVGENGERLSFGQALGRSLIKYITSHLCILLWLWPLFNPEEQSLHDLVVKSYVVKGA